jgi:hypothetical protein
LNYTTKQKKHNLLRKKLFLYKQNNDNLPLLVGILIFDLVELLNVAGPFEVFYVTRFNEKEKEGELSSSPFKVILIAEKFQIIARVTTAINCLQIRNIAIDKDGLRVML